MIRSRLGLLTVLVLLLAPAGALAQADPSTGRLSAQAPAGTTSSPTIRLSPAQAPPGATVAVSGQSFPPGATVALYFDDLSTRVGSTSVDRNGSFTQGFTVPGDADPGVHPIIACVPEGSRCVASASSDLRVSEPEPSPSPRSGAPSPSPQPPPPPPPSLVAPPPPSPPPPPPSPPGQVTVPQTPLPPSVPGQIQVSEDPVCCDPPATDQPEEAGLPPSPSPGLPLQIPDEVGEFPDLYIRGIEVTQNVQDLDSRMPLVAGRRTWIRVHPRLLGETDPWAPVDGAILVSRNAGADQLVVYPENGPIGVGGDVDRTDPNAALNFQVAPEWSNWNEPGTVAITALVWSFNPSTLDDREPNPDNNLMVESVFFQEANEPVLHIVPMDDGGGPGPDPTPQLALEGIVQFYSGVLEYHPSTNPEVLFYPDPISPGPEAQPPFGSWILTTSEGRTMPLQRMFWYHASFGIPDSERLLGIFDESIPSGDYGGWAKSSLKSSWSKPLPATAAHEVAHQAGLAHVDCKGTEEAGGALDPTHPNAAPDCSLAPVDESGYFGFTVYRSPFTIYSNDPAHAMAAFPLMSYMDVKWSDPYHWCKLLTFYGVQCSPSNIGVPGIPIPDPPHGSVDCSPEQAGGFQLELCVNDPSAPDYDNITEVPIDSIVLLTPAEPQAWVLLTGVVDRQAGTGAVDQAALVEELPGSLRESTDEFLDSLIGRGGGTNEIRMQDSAGGERSDAAEDAAPAVDYLRVSASGVPVAKVPLQLDTPAGHGIGSASSDPELFMQAVPVTGDIDLIELVVAGADAASLPLSAAPPEVSDVQVSAGENGLEVTWATSDPDGDPVTASVLWSAGAGRWYPVVTATGQTSAAIPADSRLPGGPGTRIKVVANDGIRTAEALSEPFEVPDRPPVAVIAGIDDGAEVGLYDVLELNSLAQDPEDGMLEGDALTWESNRDGLLGTGRSITTRLLSSGRHVVTLTAVDSSGASAQADVSFTVVDTGRPAPRLQGAVPGAEVRLLAAQESGIDWAQAAIAGLVVAAVAGGLGLLQRRRSRRLPKEPE